MRSATGRRFLAVRSNERAAMSLGIDVPAMKLLAFALASFLAGIGGSLIGYSRGQLSAESFGVFVGVSMLAFAYLGGITSVSGAFVAGTFAPLGPGLRVDDPRGGRAGRRPRRLLLPRRRDRPGQCGHLQPPGDRRSHRRGPPTAAREAGPGRAGGHLGGRWRRRGRRRRPDADARPSSAGAGRRGVRRRGDQRQLRRGEGGRRGQPRGPRRPDHRPDRAERGRQDNLHRRRHRVRAVPRDRPPGRRRHQRPPLAQASARGLVRTWQSLELFDELSVRRNLRGRARRRCAAWRSDVVPEPPAAADVG